MKKTLRLFGFVGISFMLAACSSAPSQGSGSEDPLEGYNRAMFSFNEGIDTVLLRPLARGYRYITPIEARRGFRNAFTNLHEPVNAVNSALQGNFKQFLASNWRFVLNTTVGLGGLYDFAGEYGNLPLREEDFGQTLAVWTGDTESTYVVLPFVGPHTARDTVGLVVDIFTSPWFYMLNTRESLELLAGETVVNREALLDTTDHIYKTSFDPYASLRSAYQQHRTALIKNRHSASPLATSGH